MEFRRGAGSSLEVLYGKVSLTPTLLHTVGTSTVLPAPSTFDLINGIAVATNVAPSPAPVGGQVDWAYTFKITDNFGKTWEYMAGVPEGTTEINFNVLPRYFTTKPPLFGQGPQGVPGEAATIEIGAVGATPPGSAPVVTNSGTANEAVLSFELPRGETGPPGVGVTNLATDTSADNLPYTYPEGVSLFVVGASFGGWPLNNSKVTTERRGTRVTQEVISIDNRKFTRSSTNNVWTPFKSTGDLVTTTTDGIMSSADKRRIDEGFAVASYTHALADLSTTYNRGASNGLEQAAGGWPDALDTVVTYKNSGLEAGTSQLVFPVTATSQPPYYRVTRNAPGNPWTALEQLADKKYVDAAIVDAGQAPVGVLAREYGVVGDGVVDDSAACNAAAVASVALGLPLIFERTMVVRLDSTFEVVANAIIYTNNCVFKGITPTGRSSKINVRSGAQIYGTLNVETPGGVSGMGVIVYGSDVYIENVRVTSAVPGMGVGNSRDNGVRVDNAHRVTFGRVYVKNFEWSFSGENSNDLTIGYIEIDNYSRGLHMNDCNNANVGGGNIYGISPNASYLPGYNGVLIGNDDVLRSVRINDVTVRDAQEHGFRLGGPNEINDVYFKNCVSINSVGTGFKCLGSIQSAQIFSKNIVYDNCISEDSGLVNQNTNGFLLQMVDGLTMINPIVRNRNKVSSGYAGIRLGGANNVVITSPLIINANQYGIHIDSDLGTNNDISITGAKIQQKTGWMIYLSNGVANGAGTTFRNISIEANIRAMSADTNAVYLGTRQGETEGAWRGVNYLDLKIDTDFNLTKPAISPSTSAAAASYTYARIIGRRAGTTTVFKGGSEWTDLSTGLKFLSKAGSWVEQ